ncbi:MAG: GMC family oxidoreductase [Bacteroidetes bacterium]|nr:MAG: GMC family oxidoreductase [Bacteroidota bacterium]
MPGDTLHLNTQATRKNTYDAIVIGSGISGGWAAKELCEKGLKVLMLERGSKVEHPNYLTATKNPWDFPHRGKLSTEDRRIHYVQQRHYSFRDDNKHFYINDKENPYQETKRFDWIRGDIVGGRSLLWARACFRWSDLDFEANAKDGIAVDWPIRYKDIAPWYDYVEDFIGVSGQADGIPQLPDGKFQPPMEMNCVEKFFKSEIEKKFNDRKVIIGRTANLTAPVKGRGLCQYRNLCHRGCPFGAYFSTNASTLPAAFATGNLTLKDHSLVNQILYDEKNQRASGVEVINTETNQTETYFARIIFLNAATVATTFILLNSKSSRFPNGLGNGSDQVGRNLMDHHKTLNISAKIDGYEDKYYFGRRPNGIYIPRFRNVKEKRSDYIRGFGMQAGAGRDRSNSNTLGIGVALKEGMTEPGSWFFGFTGFGECLPYVDNRVTLNPDLKDKWGRNSLTVDAEFRDNEKSMNKDILAAGREMLEAIGAKDIHITEGMSFPGNSNHEMGTARMGKDPKTSVLNAFNQMHEVKNVFITDGSAMVSSGWVNPSLTYMALTARAANHAVEELKRGNL